MSHNEINNGECVSRVLGFSSGIFRLDTLNNPHTRYFLVTIMLFIPKPSEDNVGFIVWLSRQLVKTMNIYP